MHPSLIWRDAATELSEPFGWGNADVAQIVAESSMLDVRNAGLASRQWPSDPRQGAQLLRSAALDGDDFSTPRVHTIDIQGDSRPRVSLKEMIDTALTLKSGKDIEIVDPAPGWTLSTSLSSRSLIQTRTGFTRVGNSQHSSAIQDDEDEDEDEDCGVPARALKIISNLQREILLLRNELNFEFWLGRENAKHIGRLYKNHILTKDAEVEQQGLVRD
jgi:hypothetical protein